MLVGIVFIASAFLKLNSIDSFEIYLYSFGLMELNLAFLMARLIISIELLLGILMVLRIYIKEVISFSILMLIGFCVFLIYLIFADKTEHCHCFGDALQMSHSASIIKNIVFIGLLGFVFPCVANKRKYSKYILLFLMASCISVPLIVSPPDSFVVSRYTDKASYDERRLKEFVIEDKISNEPVVLCFFGVNCRFCKLAAKKMSVISDKADEKKYIKYVFWGDSIAIKNFYSETNTPAFQYSSIPGNQFLKITEGKMPLILLLENGKVINKYGYRDLDENKIIDFLKKQK